MSNTNKIHIKPHESITSDGKTSTHVKNIKHKQQTSIASLKSRNPSNLPNAFSKPGVYLDFRISSDFDKIDKIDDIFLSMTMDVDCNYRSYPAGSTGSSGPNNYYINPAVLTNSNWLVDRVEYYVSGTLFDTQHSENLFMENCYKSNNDLLTEKDGGGYNDNYLEFSDNNNSIIYPTDTTYVPSLTPPTKKQSTATNVNRTLRLGRNLVNKVLLKAINDEITIRVYFNTLTEINGSTASAESLTLTKCSIYMQGVKYSPSELENQLLEKYIDKEYTFTSIVRKYNSINFDSLTPGVQYSADIGNFAGTFNTFGAYLNYQNTNGELNNQRIVKSGYTFTGSTPNWVPANNGYMTCQILSSNGLEYIVDKKQSYNPYYDNLPSVFDMDITLQDGNGDSYPYDRNLSTQIVKNFSANNNYSDFTKSFSIYPFNFGEDPNCDYWDQTITSGHYVFDNSSTLLFTPKNLSLPSNKSYQLIVVGTQLCQASVKNKRIFFKYL